MQPFYATLLSYPRQYATALGNRLWKWYVTALGNPTELPRQYATAYRNGMQPLYATLLSYSRQYATAYGNGRQPLMEMVLALPKSLEPLHLFSRKASQYQ